MKEDYFQFFIFITFFFLFFFYIHWTNWTENAYMALTRSLVDKNSLNIDAYFNISGDRAFFQGNYFIAKEPELSFLSTPVYSVWKMFNVEDKATGYVYDPSVGKTIIYTDPGRFTLGLMIVLTVFTSSLFGALTMVLVFKFIRYLSNQKFAIIITFIFGLGTVMFPYSLIYFSHAVQTFIIFLSFFLIFKYKKEGNFNYVFLAMILLGFSAVVDIISLIPVIVLGFYVFSILFKKPKLLAISIFFLFIGILPLLVYNYSIFKTPLTSTRFYMDSAIWQLGETERNTGGFGEFNPFVLFRVLFDPYRGLFYYYPFLIFALVGTVWMYKKYPSEVYVIVAMLILTTLMLSFRVEWHGGSSFGPRFYSFLMPFFAIPFLFLLKNISKKIKIFLLLPLIILSIFSNVVGLENWEWEIGQKGSTRMSSEFEQKANSLAPFPNVLDKYYLPLFLTYGPLSRTMESFVKGNFDKIDITDFGKIDRQDFFVNFIPLVCFFAFYFILSKIKVKTRKNLKHEKR